MIFVGNVNGEYRESGSKFGESRGTFSAGLAEREEDGDRRGGGELDEDLELDLLEAVFNDRTEWTDPAGT